MFKSQDQVENDLFNQHFDIMFPNSNLNYYSDSDELPINTFNHIEKSVNRQKIQKSSQNIIAHVLMDNQRIHEDYLNDNESTINFINSVASRYNDKKFNILVIVPPNSNINDAINKLRLNVLHYIPSVWEIIIFGGCTMNELQEVIPLQKIMSQDTSLPCLDPYLFSNLDSDVLDNKNLKIALLGRNNHYKEYLKLLKQTPKGLTFDQILNKITPILDQDETIPFVKDYAVWKDIFSINKLNNLEIISILDENKFIDQNITITNIYQGKIEFNKKGLIIKKSFFTDEEKRQISLQYSQIIFYETELHNYIGFIEDLFSQIKSFIEDLKEINDNTDHNEAKINIKFNYPKFNLKLKIDKENNKKYKDNLNEKTLLEPLIEFLIK